MRAVVDTNVLLSGLRPGSRSRLLLQGLIDRQFRLVTSPLLLEELADVLSRPGWHGVFSPADYDDLLAVIREAALIVHPTERITACRDPEDNAVLECARAGRADCIVTGDEDLLTLHPFHGIPILRPADFLRRLL